MPTHMAMVRAMRMVMDLGGHEHATATLREHASTPSASTSGGGADGSGISTYQELLSRGLR